MFHIDFKFSQAHLIVPRIIGWILAILLVAIIIRNIVKSIKNKKPLFKDFRFFVKDWDKVRLIGYFVLLVLYPLAMQAIHFLPASIIFMFLFNVLFNGVEHVKGFVAAIKAKEGWSNPSFRSIIVSLIVSVVSSVLIWLIFGTLFNITLP